MTDNNMNISNTPEQELDLHRLEQVSGGLRGGKKPDVIKIASETHTACGECFIDTAKGFKLFPICNNADNREGFEGGLLKASERPLLKVCRG
jgi:hypothetical protein